MSSPDKPRLSKTEVTPPSTENTDSAVSDDIKHTRKDIEGTQERSAQNTEETAIEKAEAREKEIEIARKLDLISTIHPNNHPSEVFGSSYTLLDEPLGANGDDVKTGRKYGSGRANTLDTILQINLALAYSKAPEINELIKGIEQKSVHRLNTESLQEAAVLKGMKILDLGCGPKPTFARTARRLGADVYTVDIVPSKRFMLSLRFISEISLKNLLELEAQRHFEIDLNDLNAFEVILNRSGGNFDIVTSSAMGGGSSGLDHPSIFFLGDVLKLLSDAETVLKKGGYFYYESLHPRIKH